MYKTKIEKELSKAVVDLGFIKPTDPLLSISEKSQFGDYSSNIALQLSKQKHQNRYQSPMEIANAIIEALGHPKFLQRVEVAGAGFLNFFLKDEFLVRGIWEMSGARHLPGQKVGDIGDIGEEDNQPSAISHKQNLRSEDLKRIIVEYCDPNTHKMLHIGHLLPLTLGETLSRLLEYQGHEVYRTNYGSDIGLTVAKCLWGIEKGPREKYQEAREGSLRQKAQFLGEAYAFAHAEYEKSLEVKEKIDQITTKIYQRDPEIVPLWDETREWSLAYFDLIYSIFGTLFDRRINESEVDEVGKEIVLENLGKVFIRDEGAIIFPGEKYNLHRRVFINSKDNPMYEAKEVGLAQKYQELFQADEIKIFSDKAQDDYFKVVIAANEIIYPHLKGKVEHFSYGSVKLSTGKMSSRLGNVILAEDLINEVKAKIKTVSPGLNELSIQKLTVASIKFAFLKYSTSSDIVYDLEESISIHGDTGPYVMYVYARIMSLLKKAQESKVSKESDESEVQENRADLRQGYGLQANEDSEAEDEKIAQKHSTPSTQAKGLGSFDSLSLEPEEREILRQLEYFEFTVEKATINFQPNELTKYLLNLTKAFNMFYEKHSVIGSKKADFRLLLARKVAENIKLGLYLLGIETVERM